MVGELVRNPEHEPRAYAVMPFVWSIGTIIGRKITLSLKLASRLILTVQLLLVVYSRNLSRTFRHCSAQQVCSPDSRISYLTSSAHPCLCSP